MKKSTLLVTAVAALAVSSNASALTINEMTFTGGVFDVGVFTPIPNVITASETIIFGGVGDAAPAPWNIAVTQTGCVSTVACFAFNGGGSWVNAYLNNTSPYSGGSYAAPSGTFEYNGNISVDLSSFFMNWNGADIAHGGIATGTVDGSGNFSILWTSELFGPFGGGVLSYWTMTGTVSAVPVPAAIWLLGSGLMGLIGVARRKQAV